MALALGAWDGVILTGRMTAALRNLIRQPEVMDSFAVQSPYVR